MLPMLVSGVLRSFRNLMVPRLREVKAQTSLSYLGSCSDFVGGGSHGLCVLGDGIRGSTVKQDVWTHQLVSLSLCERGCGGLRICRTVISPRV